MSITTQEVTLSHGSVVEQVFIESESGTTIMLKSDYDAQQEAIANYVPPTFPVVEESVVEETAPEEEATPVEEETI